MVRTQEADGLRPARPAPCSARTTTAAPEGHAMTRLRTVLARRHAVRVHLREERALARALATAPTLESAHEIAALGARR